MFQTAARTQPAVAPVARFIIPTLGTRERDVEIGGAFDGTFDGHSIRVLKGASVTGELGAKIVEVHGVVRGRIRADAIHVKRTGWVEGEMEYQTLTVDPGATVNARCIPC